MRKEFFDIPPKARDNDEFCLLIFGGSQGARAINNAMVAALPHLKQFQNRLQITHQTGEADFELIKKVTPKTAMKRLISALISKI